MRAKNDNDFKRILVAQTAFLGDLVLTTPLFKALDRLYPDAEIHLMTTPAAAPLVEEDPHLDGVIRYDKKGGEPLLGIVKKLRAGNYDLFIAPHRSHRTSLIGFLSQIPVRVGYREAGFPYLYTRRTKRPVSIHEVDKILELLKRLGKEAEPTDRTLYVGYTQKEADVVEALLSEAGFGPGSKLVGFCPGSVWATKRWTPKGFGELGRELSARGFGIVLVGGPDDRPAADAVMGQLEGKAFNAVGKTGLKALAAWIDRFSLFVTNDSAPLHVAAARNVPTVALFGPTVKEQGFYPFHEKSRLVEVDIPCRPCGAHGHDRCPEDHFTCMEELSSKAVLAASLELLGVHP